MSRTYRTWRYKRKGHLPYYFVRYEYLKGYEEDMERVSYFKRLKTLRKKQRRHIRAQNRTRFAHGIYEPYPREGIYWD
jgi:hypothetical protein